MNSNLKLTSAAVLTAGAVLCPAITGAAIVAGAVGALLDENKDKNMKTQLEEAFYACRLGVVNKSNKPILPKIVREYKRDYGYRFIFTIPKGLSIHHFLEKQLALQTATNSELEMWEQDGYLHIRALTHRLPKIVQFKPFDLPEGSILPIPIGYSRGGLEIADLAHPGLVHLLCGGTTGSGKSVFLHQLVYTLCHYSHVRLCIIDLKKLEFVKYRDHAWLATTLPQAFAVIAALRQEMFKRLDMLMNRGANHITKHKEALPYMILVVDEFAQLWPQRNADTKAVFDLKQKCHSYLHDILSMARAVGIHVILSCQRPSRFILPGELKSNFGGTVAFKCRNVKTAEILDTPLAAFIPVAIPGRAIWNWKTDREVQVMYFDSDKIMLPEPVTKPKLAPELAAIAGEV